LIVNELVTNAYKHAFPGGRSGEINIEMRRNSDDLLVLTVADNGVGLPSAVDPERAETLGLTLVRTLSRQLQAELFIGRAGGTVFRFSIDPRNQGNT
jgi:two-component sensor histidine kinase